MRMISLKRKRFAAAYLLFILLLGACARNSDPVVREQLFAFGTLVEISLYNTDRQLADRAIDYARQEFDRMHRDWHAWQPGVLTGLNESLASGRTVAVPDDLGELIQRAKSLSLQSDGLFNPAIGRLVRLWGFQQDEFEITRPPAVTAIKEILAVLPDMSQLSISNNKVASANPSLQLDLGAIAKGYGIDQVMNGFVELGVSDAIINCGGDLRVIGRHGDRPWRIGIRDPRNAGVLASVELSDDESIFTSGDYERFFEWEGQRFHHILDPRTGFPADSAVSVTVIHTDAATADAAATALFVAGPENWHDIARQMGIGYVMLVDSEGVIHMNPAMERRLRIEADPKPGIHISEPL